VPSDNYRPIQPGEKGTLGEGARAVQYLPKGNAPLYSERQADRTRRQETRLLSPEPMRRNPHSDNGAERSSSYC
jgi:hypothetical protein